MVVQEERAEYPSNWFHNSSRPSYNHPLYNPAPNYRNNDSRSSLNFPQTSCHWSFSSPGLGCWSCPGRVRGHAWSSFGSLLSSGGKRNSRGSDWNFRLFVRSNCCLWSLVSLCSPLAVCLHNSLSLRSCMFRYFVERSFLLGSRIGAGDSWLCQFRMAEKFVG